MPRLLRSMGLSSAAIHWKNTTTRIPRTNQIDRVSTDRKHRGDENSGEIGLFLDVQIVWDLWSIGIIGPGLFLEVKHDPGVDERGMVPTSAGSKSEEGVSR